MEFLSSDYEMVKRCPWCSHRNYRKWGRAIREFNSAKCLNCGLIFVTKRFNKRGLIKFYKDYLGNIHQADILLNQQRGKMYELEFELISRYSKKTNVLDVGCSGGYFLDLFNKHDYKCYGVEYGDSAAEEAAKKHKVYKGEFPKININRKFDLIIFRGVIEHIPHPKAYLNKAISLINKNGLIYITSTPNSNAFCAELFKEKWNQHTPEEHLMHFNAQHFDEYFARKGFAKLIEYYFYEETPYANIEQDRLKIVKALRLNKNRNRITFGSPAFYGNMMSLIYKRIG